MRLNKRMRMKIIMERMMIVALVIVTMVAEESRPGRRAKG